jgi:phage FluMu gp28-like protein
VVVDESAFVGDSVFETLFPIVLNTKNKEQGRLVLISTPGVMAGEFYRAFQPGSIYTTFHFTHDDAIFPDQSRLLPQSELDREGQRMGFDSTFYKREYLCQWNATDNAFFSSTSIEKALNPDIKKVFIGIPGHKYAIGADLAIKNDYTVFIVLDYTDKENLQVVNHVRFHGKTPDQIMLELYKLTAAFNPIRILIDEGNIGAAVVSQLKVRYPGKRWEGFIFTTSSKTPLLTDLEIAMSSGILQIPEDDQIREELISFYYEENPTTGHLKLNGLGAHDDYPIAIALAIRAANIFSKSGGLTIGSSDGLLTGEGKAEFSKYYNVKAFV